MENSLREAMKSKKDFSFTSKSRGVRALGRLQGQHPLGTSLVCFRTKSEGNIQRRDEEYRRFCL